MALIATDLSRRVGPCVRCVMATNGSGGCELGKGLFKFTDLKG